MLHCFVCQNIDIFISIAMRNSNPTSFFHDGYKWTFTLKQKDSLIYCVMNYNVCIFIETFEMEKLNILYWKLASISESILLLITSGMQFWSVIDVSKPNM
jgi:hypothetical protein